MFWQRFHLFIYENAESLYRKKHIGTSELSCKKYYQVHSAHGIFFEVNCPVYLTNKEDKSPFVCPVKFKGLWKEPRISV